MNLFKFQLLLLTQEASNMNTIHLNTISLNTVSLNHIGEAARGNSGPKAPEGYTTFIAADGKFIAADGEFYVKL